MILKSILIGLLVTLNSEVHKYQCLDDHHVAPITFQDSTIYKNFINISEVNPKSLFLEIPCVKDILTQGIKYLSEKDTTEGYKLTKISLTISKSLLSDSYNIYVSDHTDVRIDNDGYCPAIRGNIQFFKFYDKIVFLHQFKGIIQHSIFGDVEKYIPADVLNLPISDRTMKIELLTPILYMDYGYLSWSVKDGIASKMRIIRY